MSGQNFNARAGRLARLGAKALVWMLRRLRLAAAGRRPAWLPVGRALRMHIDPGDVMDRAFYLRTYDTRLRVLVHEWLRAGDTAIDVGAHKGYCSLLMARAVGADGRVWSFEPDDRVRAVLQEHAQTNRLSWLTAFPWAVGQQTETRDFFLSKRLGWSSAFPNTSARQELAEKVSIHFRALDGLVGAGDVTIPEGRLRLLKLDCEGSEELALRGMARLLRNERPLLWIEINRDSLATAGSSASGVAAVLADYGFDLYHPDIHSPLIGAKGLLLRPVRDIEHGNGELFDVVAIPREAKSAFVAGCAPDGALLLPVSMGLMIN